MSELKPCPFCGSPGSLVASSDHSGAWEGGCSSEGCLATDCVWDISKELAIAAWNRRASPPEDVRREALEEAAAVADSMTDEIKRLHATTYAHVKIGSLTEVSSTIAAAIRALAQKETEK